MPMLCLREDPFVPVEAERRILEKGEKWLIIEGDVYENIKETIKKTIEEIVKNKGSKGLLLIGYWGSGKSAIIYRVYLDIIREQKGIVFNIVRIEKDSTVEKLLLQMIKSHLETYSAYPKELSNLINDIKRYRLEDLEEKYNRSELYDSLIKLISFALANPNIRGYVLVLDQFEHLWFPRDIDKDDLARYLRDIFLKVLSNVGSKKGFVVILSMLKQAYKEIVEPKRGLLRDYLPPLYVPDQLSLKDTKKIFEKLLSMARYETDECIKKSKINPYYPFTSEAIEEIHGRALGIPGFIYSFASRCLMRALAHHVKEIDGITARRFIFDIDPEWIKATMETPYKPLYDCIETVLEWAKENEELLDEIADYSAVEVEKIGIFKHIERLPDELKKARGVFNFIIRYTIDEKRYLALVKVVERLVRKDLAEKIKKVLETTDISVEGVTLMPENIRVIVITGGSFSLTAKAYIKDIGLKKGYKVIARIIDPSNPVTYGRLKVLAQRIEYVNKYYPETGIYELPSEIRDKLRSETLAILRILGIYPPSI